LSFIDYTGKFHPLAFLIYQADKQLKTCLEKKFFEVSEQILRLSYLNFEIIKKGFEGFYKIYSSLEPKERQVLTGLL